MDNVSALESIDIKRIKKGIWSEAKGDGGRRVK